MHTYLYRGVHARHPAIEEARRGVVRVASPNSPMSAEEHNLEGIVEQSPFTSWTRDRTIAEARARSNGSGGVLLRVSEGSPGATDQWKWEYSPDVYGEQEVLPRGVRMGLEVISL